MTANLTFVIITTKRGYSDAVTSKALQGHCKLN